MHFWQYELVIHIYVYIYHIELILHEFYAEVKTICTFQTPQIVYEIYWLCTFFLKTLMPNDVQINANALFANAFDVRILSSLYYQS